MASGILPVHRCRLVEQILSQAHASRPLCAGPNEAPSAVSARSVEVVSDLLPQLSRIRSRSDDNDSGELGITHAVAGECLGIGEVTVDLINGRFRARHLSSSFGLFAR